MEKCMNKLVQERDHESCSSCSQFARCPRLYYYSTMCRLTRSSAIRDRALHFGKSIHAGASFAAQGLYDEAINFYEEAWNEGGVGSLVGEDEKRNIGTARGIFQALPDSFSSYTFLPPPLPTRASDAVSDYEFAFGLELHKDLPPFVGRIDGFIRDSLGNLWILEYKTTSELSSRFIEQFRTSPQLGSYAAAVHLLTGEKIQGAILVGLLVSKHTVRISCIEFPIQPVRYQHYLDWAAEQCEGMKKCKEKEDYPRSWACSPYPGFGQTGYTCEFTDLCIREPWYSLIDQYELKPPHTFELLSKEKPDEDGTLPPGPEAI